MLRELAAYSRIEGDDAPLHHEWKTKTSVSRLYRIMLTADGELLDPKPQETEVPELLPTSNRRSNVLPHLGSDKASYTLATDLLPPLEGEKQRRHVEESHRCWKRQLVDVSEEHPDHEPLRAIASACLAGVFGTLDLSDISEPEKQLYVLYVAGSALNEDPVVQSIWLTMRDEQFAGPEHQCSICGEIKPIAKLMPSGIKGVPKTQGNGGQLVSTDKPAFRSYAMDQALGAHSCLECSFKWIRNLESLLADEHHRYRAGDSVWVTWASSPLSINPLDMVGAPRKSEILNALKAPWTGQGVKERDTRIYVAELVGNSARIIPRTWWTANVAEVHRNIAAWFENSRLGESEPVGIASLVTGLREVGKQKPHGLDRALILNAYRGTPIGLGYLAPVLAGLRAATLSGKNSPSCIRLIRLIMSTTTHSVPAELDALHPHPAYHCGRLLAVLGQLQRDALGDVGATVTDRYYGATATSPSKTVGPLLRESRHHLAKLRSTRSGLATFRERQIGEVLSHLTDVPSVLTLQEQALFGLGYYHQRESFFAVRPKTTDAAPPAETQSND